MFWQNRFHSLIQNIRFSTISFMVDQIEIEKYCNRYEELYELVRLIEQPSVSAEGIERLEKKLDEALSDMSKLHDNKSSCTPLAYLFC